MKKYCLALPKRTVTLTFNEHPEAVYLALEFSSVGSWKKFGDREQFTKWYKSLVEAYDNDPRPFVMRNPRSGERAVVYDGLLIVQKTDS